MHCERLSERERERMIEDKRHFLHWHQIMRSGGEVIFDERLLLGVLQRSLTRLGNSLSFYYALFTHLNDRQVRQCSGRNLRSF